ncbi:MAG: hypothetical protein EOP85_14205, partial [Verrucomicrobiaceae bacterium]
MKFLHKRWRHLLISLSLLTVVCVAGIVWWAGSEIASPPRRGLMDYHEEFLADAAARGVRIEKFTASDGTPCLVCTPLSDGTTGERGAKIRQQLTGRGINLPPAGTTSGTLVLLHGRKGRKEDYLPIAERLCASGFRCIIPDLPAHGEHPTGTVTYGVREAGIPAADMALPVHRAALAKIATRLVNEAEPYYTSANGGLHALPLRSAWAIATAHGVYRQIGIDVRAKGITAWDQRVSTSKATKLRLLAT